MSRISKRLRSCAFVLAVVLVAGGITGCEQAPDRASGDSTEAELASEQYVTVQEAKEQAEELAGQSIDGIRLSDYVQLPDGDSVSAIKLTPWHMAQEDSDALLTAVQGIWPDYGSVDWSQIENSYTDAEPGDYYWDLDKMDEDTGLWFGYDSRGCLGVGSMYFGDMLTGGNCVKTYDFEWGDEAGEDAWELLDGEYSVAEAVEMVEGCLNEYLSPLEDDKFTYRVQHLYVMKNSDTGCYEYNISIGRVYDGMAVETSSDYEFFSAGKYYDVVQRGQHFIAAMRHKGALDFFTIGTELFDIESAEEEESIISPMWALQQIKENIAHEGGMDCTCWGLVYVLEQDNPSLEAKKQGYFDIVNDTTYLRPVWIFLTDEQNGGIFSTTMGDEHGECVLVDAVTGELYYYDGTGAY